jgi:putative endonuclease
MKQFVKKGLRNQIGAYGEHIASQYLIKHGYTILSTNYLKKWGEIDIVARETSQSGPVIHFVEVKTVSHETKAKLKIAIAQGSWRPEENVNGRKLNRLYRVIESWLSEYSFTGNWQIDVIAVRVVPREKYATVKYLANIVE